MDNTTQGSNLDGIPRIMREYVRELMHMPEAERLDLVSLINGTIIETYRIMEECSDPLVSGLFSEEASTWRKIAALIREGSTP